MYEGKKFYQINRSNLSDYSYKESRCIHYRTGIDLLQTRVHSYLPRASGDISPSGLLGLALSKEIPRNNINPYYNIPYVRLTGLVARRSSVL